MSYEHEDYIPDKLPEKVMLVGGGQPFNQFMIVNCLKIEEVKHPKRGHENETVKKITVERQDRTGIRIFEAFLSLWKMESLGVKYKDTPLDTYTIRLGGEAYGRVTQHIIRM